MKKIPQPESQVQEVLYELINRFFIDRRTMMLSSGVWNLTARISNLRNMGLQINSNEIVSKNKFNREIKFVQYSLEDKKAGIALYLNLKDNQTGIPEL